MIISAQTNDSHGDLALMDQPKEKIVNVVEIVNDGLKLGEFGGLYVPGTCGCLVDELDPADCLSAECCAGYKHTHSESGEWVVAKQKSPLSDDEIEEIINDC